MGDSFHGDYGLSIFCVSRYTFRIGQFDYRDAVRSVGGEREGFKLSVRDRADSHIWLYRLWLWSIRGVDAELAILLSNAVYRNLVVDEALQEKRRLRARGKRVCKAAHA